MSDERLLAALSVAAVVLNAVTAGDHLVKTLFTETYWPVAGGSELSGHDAHCPVGGTQAGDARAAQRKCGGG